MLIRLNDLCRVDSCTRPGCSPANGCQGHVYREMAPHLYRRRVQQLVEDMARDGLVLTVEQVPLQPLAMGNTSSTVHVREARKKAG